MSNGMNSIVLNLNDEKALGEPGRKLLELVSAQVLVYAAIALFVFEESYYADDLLTNYPEQHITFIEWLEHFGDAASKEIHDLRTFYEIPYDPSDASPGRNATSYQLIRVGYSSSDEYLFVRASKCESHRHFGNEWRVLNESDEDMSGHRSLT